MIGQQEFLQRIVERLQVAYDNYDGKFEVLGTDVDPELTDIDQFGNNVVKSRINSYCYDYTPKGKGSNTWIFSKIPGVTWPSAVSALKEGEEMLYSLPKDIKDRINARYVSGRAFYDLVYTINGEYRTAFKKKDENAKKYYEDLRWKVSCDLESLGISDGTDIFDAIAGDSDEDYLNQKIAALSPFQKDLLQKL